VSFAKIADKIPPLKYIAPLLVPRHVRRLAPVPSGLGDAHLPRHTGRVCGADGRDQAGEGGPANEGGGCGLDNDLSKGVLFGCWRGIDVIGIRLNILSEIPA